jgi:hypothetical protein
MQKPIDEKKSPPQTPKSILFVASQEFANEFWDNGGNGCAIAKKLL